MLAHCGEELDSCKGTIGDQDDVAAGKPAPDLQRGLPCPVDQCLWGSQFVRVEALGGCEHRKEWQRHDAISHGTCTSNREESQRRPRTLTQCPSEERTGSL